MQKDISLWNGNFGHANEFGFVRSVTSLFGDRRAGSDSITPLLVQYVDEPVDLTVEGE